MEIPPEFEKEINSLLEGKGAISASKISAIAKLAMKYYKFYKHVVFAVERVFSKSGPEFKLSCVYVVDAICRASKKEKDEKFSVYPARFESRLAVLFDFLAQQRVSSKDKEKIKRVASLWGKSQIFSLAVLTSLQEKYPDLVGDLSEVEAEPAAAAPDTAALVASLANIKPAAVAAEPVVAKRADPLAFDYGDDTDGEGADSSKLEQQQRDAILQNSSLPPAIASLLSSTLLTTSHNLNQPQTPLQTTFTLQHQQQLASLLAAQGYVPAPPPPVVAVDTRALQSPVQPSMPPLSANPMQRQSHYPPQQHQQSNFPSSSSSSMPQEFFGISNEPACEERVKKYDPSIELDQLKVLTRTLYVGGINAAVTEEMLRTMFVPYQPETVGLYHEKAHAFVKLRTRDCAERAKRDFWNSKAELLGESLKLNWACGVGRKDTFDRRQGHSIAKLSEMSDAEKRWYYVELGMDFMKQHTAELLELKGNSAKIQQPIHLGALVLEEPENLSLKRSENRGSFDDGSPRKRPNYGPPGGARADYQGGGGGGGRDNYHHQGGGRGDYQGRGGYRGDHGNGGYRDQQQQQYDNRR